MNKTLEYIHNNPKETKRIIGITYPHLKKLIENAIKINMNKKNTISAERKLLIKSGGGRKKHLNAEDEIILTLYYLHHILTFQILGIHFGVSESTANNIFHYWIDILIEFYHQVY